MNPIVDSQFDPIGYLVSDFQQRFATPRQGALVPSGRAILTLTPKWHGAGALEGLEKFSHVWLISLLHASPSKNPPTKVHPPRLKGEKVGVFASRSPHRPNPIGLTLARIREVKRDQLILSEVDLIDQTPILDIKPYVAPADRPLEFSNGWTNQLEDSNHPVQFATICEQQLAVLVPEAEGIRIRSLIEETLRLDPRPLSYLEKRDFVFAARLAGLDVHFQFENETFKVIGIYSAATTEALRPNP